MKNLLCLFLCVLSIRGAAQDRVLSGIVQDENKAPIQGANVYLVNSYDGTTTDEDGSFSFATQQTGEQTIAVHLIGYQDYTVSVDLSQPAATLQVSLQEEALQLAGATVTASRDFEASDRHKVTVLNRLDVLTTGGSNADITYALQTLPGTQPAGNQSGLFVRGGTGNETRVYIDGLAVDNFYYQGTPGVAQRGRFSPDLFQGSFFSSGGYSALYGQALSSTLILASRDLPDQSSIDVSVSSVGAEAGVDLLSKDKRGSGGATVRYTNLLPYFNFVEQLRTFEKMPEYLDGTVNFRRKVGADGIIKFYGSYGQSSVALAEADLEDLSTDYLRGVDNRNLYTNLTYRGNVAESVQLDVGTSFSTNENHFGSRLMEPSSAHDDSYQTSRLYQGRSVLTKFYDNVELKVGGEVLYSEEEADYQSAAGSKHRQASDYLTVAFAESRFTALKKLRGQFGVRLENSSLLDKSNVAPRASLAYLTGKQSQLSLAYGHFYQKPEKSYLLYALPLEYEKSQHYILSFQHMKTSQTLRAELFYKQYDGLIKTSPDTSNTGYGYAQGAEIFWRDKKTVPKLDYWISYSYLDTKRDYLDYYHLARPDFAASHTASVVTKRFISSLSTSVGLTYTFASGRPYFNPNRPADEFMLDRTTSYHNLSAMVAYLTKIKQANAIFVMSVKNVLGTEQVFGYQYATNNPAVRRASTPLAPRFFYLGVFLNWGVDKRQQTIDDLL